MVPKPSVQSWLDLLIESTKESEAPERYFWWAGLCAISAALRKKVFIRRGAFYKLYPNIYVALVSARSGLRKGIPISIVKNLVEEIDKVRVISGCNSIQGLIKELSMQKTFKSGAVINEAQGLLLSDEFESFITEDPRALTYLTALHNTWEHEKSWTKNLRNSPVEELKSPCLSLLVASNEILFESMVKTKDIEGGFIARTFIIHESKRRKVNSLIYTQEELDKIIAEDTVYHTELISRLKDISEISGEFTWDNGVGNLYTKWYQDLVALEIDDRTGTIERLGDQVIKVAMLVALSNHGELVIRKDDLEKAVTESEICLVGVKAISLEKGTSDVNPIIEKVLKVLLKAPNQEITRQKLMTITHIEALLLDRALETLQQRGAIELPKRNSKKEVFYKMTKEVFEAYMKFKTAEN
jgi:ribosome biogenesis protein Tsr3